jgi:hypothetical protein
MTLIDQKKVYDYLNHPPQRYVHVSAAMVENTAGEWVKFKDMDLYMFEGAQLMQQVLAELNQVRGLLKFANEGHYQAIEIRTYLASRGIT